jgi:hypothetical protein
MHLWINMWTCLFFGGVGIFALLAILVIVYGASDLIYLLSSLKVRHDESMVTAQESGSGEPKPTSVG